MTFDHTKTARLLASFDSGLSVAELAPWAEQLCGAVAEVERLEKRDLFKRDCEWFIATHAEPWLSGRADFPKCENAAHCVGETTSRKSQYILCREHAEQWDGGLVAMSGEPVAVPRHIRAEIARLTAERDAMRPVVEAAEAVCAPDLDGTERMHAAFDTLIPAVDAYRDSKATR
jgi:hypothetical protein